MNVQSLTTEQKGFDSLFFKYTYPYGVTKTDRISFATFCSYLAAEIDGMQYKQKNSRKAFVNAKGKKNQVGIAGMLCAQGKMNPTL